MNTCDELSHNTIFPQLVIVSVNLRSYHYLAVSSQVVANRGLYSSYVACPAQSIIMARQVLFGKMLSLASWVVRLCE